MYPGERRNVAEVPLAEAVFPRESEQTTMVFLMVAFFLTTSVSGHEKFSSTET
jgi:hypothetical protein